MNRNRKTLRYAAFALLVALSLALPVAAETVDHVVVPGDTMWKTAVRYRVGLDEIIAANPQIRDPHWIYPGDVLHVPLPDDAVASYERAVVDLVNNIRTSRGLGKLEENWELSRVARYKSRDMQEKRYFSHTSPTYGSPFDMMRAFGLAYRTAGENIAMGYPAPQSVVDGWMNSEGHRKNILNPAFTVIGVGYVSEGNYWTQMFIG